MPPLRADAHATPRIPRRPLPSRLYAIVDADSAARAGWRVPDLADAYLQAGVRFLQVRAKDAATSDLLAWIDAIARHAPADAWILVNDRVDVARAAGTRHVHLGQDDLPVGDARAILGREAVIGLSTHTGAQIAEACRAAEVDYMAVGPVFGTRTKVTGYAPVGTTLVGVARAEALTDGALPIVAIGGITLDTAPAVIEAGAGAVAVIGDLLVDGDPGARARAFLRALGES